MKVGDIVAVDQFSYINKAGGTGLSSGHIQIWKGSSHDESFDDIAWVELIKVWDDYECGERGWAVPMADVNANQKKLFEYLERNAQRGFPVEGLEGPCRTDGSDTFVLFVGEFHIVEGNK